MPKILLVFNSEIRDEYIRNDDLDRLGKFVEWQWLDLRGGARFEANTDPDSIHRLRDNIESADGVVICHGSPKISREMMDYAPTLRIIGELEGDRFATRIDLEEAWNRGIKTLDTTNGSSYPVAEWALGLILISVKNAGSLFRRIIKGDTGRLQKDDFGYLNGELYGKTVGLIGCGHIGRRLIQFLAPFQVELKVYDPYIQPEIGDILGFTRTSLENVLSGSEVIVCLAPLTPSTTGLLGKTELDLISSGSVFVNMSRGPIVDSHALINRLKKGDIVAGLDVFDPEPIPRDSDIIHLPNVFLSPHIAGVTAASYERFFTLMVDELDLFFGGHETRFDLTVNSMNNRSGADV